MFNTCLRSCCIGAFNFVKLNEKNKHRFIVYTNVQFLFNINAMKQNRIIKEKNTVLDGVWIDNKRTIIIHVEFHSLLNNNNMKTNAIVIFWVFIYIPLWSINTNDTIHCIYFIVGFERFFFLCLKLGRISTCKQIIHALFSIFCFFFDMLFYVVIWKPYLTYTFHC